MGDRLTADAGMWLQGERVSMPDIEHPTLCYRQEVVDTVITTFERCDRPKGHRGPHSWELASLVRKIKVLLPEYQEPEP